MCDGAHRAPLVPWPSQLGDGQRLCRRPESDNYCAMSGIAPPSIAKPAAAAPIAPRRWSVSAASITRSRVAQSGAVARVTVSNLPMKPANDATLPPITSTLGLTTANQAARRQLTRCRPDRACDHRPPSLCGGSASLRRALAFGESACKKPVETQSPAWVPLRCESLLGETRGEGRNPGRLHRSGLPRL